MTVHAAVFGGEDWREGENLAARVAETDGDDELASTARRFGMQLVEVPDLRDPLVYVASHRLLLVRAGMSGACRDAAAAHLLVWKPQRH
ncbi:hypothetical protein [Actinotalea ferrariae]|nr:hypothetical protein [Actinotalea ferrariae]